MSNMALLAITAAVLTIWTIPALANCPTQPCPDPATQYFNCRDKACACTKPSRKIDTNGICVPKCPSDQKPIPLQTTPYKCVCKKRGQKPNEFGKCVYAPPPAPPSPPPPTPPPPGCIKTPCPDPKAQHFDCKWGMCMCNDKLTTIDKDGKCVPKCPDDQTPVPLKGMMYKCACKNAEQTINLTTGKCEYPSPPPVASPPPSASPPPPCATHSEGGEGEEGDEGFHHEGEEGESEGERSKPPPCVVTPPPAPKCAKKGESCTWDSNCCKYEDCGSYLECDDGKCNEKPPPAPKAPPPTPQCGQQGDRCWWDKDCCSFGQCGKYLKCKWWRCQE